jgi:phosphoribosylamine--glycine ligase
VFKPSGKTIPSKLTYVADDRDDLICYLDFVEKYFAKDIDDFILQCFVEGAVVSSEFWCGPTGFVRPGNQTVEVKKFMNDNLGPSTGCQGNLVWICDEGKILKQGICKAENALIDNGYIGPIDLNAIVNEEGVYGLEWTPRFGLDAMPTLLQLLTMDVGELVSNLVKGQLHEFPADDSFAGGVRVSIPPYPIEPISTKGTYEVQKNSPNFGVPLRFPERFEDNYYFYEIVSENGDLYHSDGTGIIAVISAAREECEESIKACYDIIEEVKIPDIQYRTDLAEVLPDMYEEVKEQELCLT